TKNLEASVAGHFSLVDLPASIQLYLSYYLPNYISSPVHPLVNQQLAFSVKLKEPDDLLNLFGRPFELSAHAELTGSMDMSRQNLSIAGNAPWLKYGKFVFQELRLRGDGTYSGLNFEASANGIRNGQREMVSLVEFTTHLYQDTARFQLHTTTPTSLGKAEVSGVAIAEQDSFYVRLLPSEFYLNAARWEISEGSSAVFAKDVASIHNVRIHSGLQRVLVNVAP